MVDLSVRQELISLVEELTHTGLQSLNEEKMKTLKTLCKCVESGLRVCGDLASPLPHTGALSPTYKLPTNKLCYSWPKSTQKFVCQPSKSPVSCSFAHMLLGS